MVCCDVKAVGSTMGRSDVVRLRTYPLTRLVMSRELYKSIRCLLRLL